MYSVLVSCEGSSLLSRMGPSVERRASSVEPVEGQAPRREVGVDLAKFDRPAATDCCQVVRCEVFWGNLDTSLSWATFFFLE